MYSFKLSEKLQDTLSKLSRKDNQLYERVLAKINEVVSCYDVEHYKNLRYNMKESKRVHIEHFVLIFQYDKTNNEILFDDFDHHDIIYKR
jgi:mRNA-degrading endonuclease RelE of RelBE toxin-antitoxin system